MNILTALLIASSIFGPAFTAQPKVNSKDLQRITGAQWKGTLTYLDYRSNKKVSIPSHLRVTRSVEDKFRGSSSIYIQMSRKLTAEIR